MTCVRRYNASGNGSDVADDGYQLSENGSDDEVHVKWGHFNYDLAMTKGGDNRQNFLSNYPTNVLYWWHVLDNYEVLQYTCVVFNSECGAKSTEIPTPTKNKRNETNASNNTVYQAGVLLNQIAMLDNIHEVGNRLGEMSYAILLERVQDMKKEKLSLEREIYGGIIGSPAMPDGLRLLLQARVDELSKFIDHEELKLARTI